MLAYVSSRLTLFGSQMFPFNHPSAVGAVCSEICGAVSVYVRDRDSYGACDDDASKGSHKCAREEFCEADDVEKLRVSGRRSYNLAASAAVPKQLSRLLPLLTIHSARSKLDIF